MADRWWTEQEPVWADRWFRVKRWGRVTDFGYHVLRRALVAARRRAQAAEAHRDAVVAEALRWRQADHAERDRVAAECAAMREALERVACCEKPVVRDRPCVVCDALASDAGAALLAERDALRAKADLFDEMNAQRQQLIRDAFRELDERALDREAMREAKDALGTAWMDRDCNMEPAIVQAISAAVEAIAARLGEGGGE